MAATRLWSNTTPTRLLLSLNLAATSVSCSNRKILALAVPAPLGSYDARGAPVSWRPPDIAEGRYRVCTLWPPFGRPALQLALQSFARMARSYSTLLQPGSC